MFAEEANEPHQAHDGRKRKRTPRDMINIYGTVANRCATNMDRAGREQMIRRTVGAEMVVYSNLKIHGIIDDTELLGWWRDSANTLPHMSKFSRFILAIPATSASAERWFSYGGITETKLRQRLSPDTLESLLFLKSNWKYVDISDAE